MEAQQQPRNRRADGVRDRNRRHEHRHRFAPVFLPEPVRQINHHRRKKSAFSQPQKKANRIELGRAPDHARRGSEHAPHDHDRRDPPPRAPQIGQHRSRYLQQAIPKEEDPRPEAEYFIREMQLPRHVQPRESHVHAVHKRRNVQHEQERDQSPGNLPPGLGAAGNSHE